MIREKLDDGTTKLTGDVKTSPWPVGSIFTSIDPTNPTTYFGGTWVRFANGRMLVGVNESDTSFDSVMETGGEKTHTLTSSEVPSHNHGKGTISASYDGDHSHGSGTLNTGIGGSHSHQINRRSDVGSSTGFARGNATAVDYYNTEGAGEHWHTITGSTSSTGGHYHSITGETDYSGGGGSHNNMPPYITVYMWRRTA